MRRASFSSAGLVLVTVLIPRVASAAPPSGAALYAKHCAMCHDKSGETRAPARAVLASVTVERMRTADPACSASTLRDAIEAAEKRDNSPRHP